MKTVEKMNDLSRVTYIGGVLWSVYMYLLTLDVLWFIAFFMVDIGAALHLIFLQKEEEE